jgi:integrase
MMEDQLRETSVAALRKHLRELIEADDEMRRDAPPFGPVYTRIAPEDSSDVIDADLEVVEELLGVAQERLANRDAASRLAEANALITEYGLPGEQRYALALGVLHAEVRLLEIIRRRVLGWPEAPWLLEEPIAAEPPAWHPPTVVDHSGPKLSEVLLTYFNVANEQRGWTEQTRAQSEETFDMFMEVCGDLPIGTYTRAHTGTFYDVLQQLPETHGHLRPSSRISLKAIVDGADAHVPRTDMKTIKRHFSTLGSLFTDMIRRGQYRGPSPAHGFEFPQAAREVRGGHPYWHGEKLAALFASPVWTGSHDYFRAHPGKHIIRDEKFWLPLLALYHGARLEDFAQLRREDIRQEEGIWYFTFTDQRERQLKKIHLIRRIPIHPVVINVGFLDYAIHADFDDQDLIFPDLKPSGPDKKLGYSFTRWWTHYRKQMGLYDPALDFDAFRHGVFTRLCNLNVSPVIAYELTGHAGIQQGPRGYHESPTSLRTLYEAICVLEWPEVDFSHLQSWRAAPRLQ